MGKEFSSDLREFERIVARITQVRDELSFLEAERNRLRRRLVGAGRSEGVEATELTTLGLDTAPEAIRKTVEAVRRLGGPVRVADVAKAQQMDEKVVANLLARATKMRFLIRKERGKYEIYVPLVRKHALEESENSKVQFADASSTADTEADDESK